MKKNVSIKTTAIAVILACIICASVVASVLYQRNVSNTMRIVGGNFKLVKGTNPDIEVTSIAWGDFLPGDLKNSSTIVGDVICIYNMANINLIFCWNYTDLPEGWTLTCKSDGNNYPKDFWNQFSIAAGGVNGYMVFYLTAPAGAMADYGFTINVFSAKNV